MQLSHLDMAHPLRQARQLPVRSRMGAVAATVVAHLVVIAGLIAGLQQARIIHPPEMAVHFSPETKKPVELPPAPPAPVQVIAAYAAPEPPVLDVSPRPAPVAAASGPMWLPSPPSANPGGETSNAGPSWETALLNRLAQAKRYPPSAQAAKQKGVVLLRFTMDRDGKVLSAGIEHSSGFAALDQEALAAIQRAQPLPAPPPEVLGNPLDLIVPVEFL